jgi:hypothetical protein
MNMSKTLRILLTVLALTIGLGAVSATVGAGHKNVEKSS